MVTGYGTTSGEIKMPQITALFPQLTGVISRVDKFTGAVESWTNDGQPASGQPWKWTSRGRTSSGVAPGACVQFANVNANGGKRADYIDITPETAEAFAYYNECPASSS